MALLDGREAKTLKPWLKQHPKIDLVARDRASAYAQAIKEILPTCTQVADRFHLFQNLLDHLKAIFMADLPATYFIQNDQLLDQPPKRIRVEKELKVDLTGLDYDNTPPVTATGGVMPFDNKEHNLNSVHYLALAAKRQKKQQFIRALQAKYPDPTAAAVKPAALAFKKSPATIRKYLKLTAEEIRQLARPRNYKKHKNATTAYLNVIFKMMQDGLTDQVIYAYIMYAGLTKNKNSLRRYIYLISKDNFPERPTRTAKMAELYNSSLVYPKDVIVIQRRELFKYLTTLNSKVTRSKKVAHYLAIITAKYPLVTEVETIFKSFHDVMQGHDTTQLDTFIDRYQASNISSFCTSIKKDIAPVKSAISLNINSGFVEGNNNKLKLLKRIVYGRSGIVNLTKKTKLAFLTKQPYFQLNQLLI
ncbi:transposase [Loigolactobacillus coryniformis]|nr:transposase [Loigolactobacillus coryniformis]MDC4186036.1 transposase [Loigolactobacillus coryniformis]